MKPIVSISAIRRLHLVNLLCHFESAPGVTRLTRDRALHQQPFANFERAQTAHHEWIPRCDLLRFLFARNAQDRQSVTARAPIQPTRGEQFVLLLELDHVSKVRSKLLLEIAASAFPKQDVECLAGDSPRERNEGGGKKLRKCAPP